MATAPHRNSRLASRLVASPDSTHGQTTPLAHELVRDLPPVPVNVPKDLPSLPKRRGCPPKVTPLRVDVAGPPSVPPVQSDKQKRERLPITEPLLAETGRPWTGAELVPSLPNASWSGLEGRRAQPAPTPVIPTPSAMDVVN